MERPFDDEGMKRNLSGRKRKAAEPSSSSSPSRTIDRRTFDIFLSFRGEDTRKGFTSHLYNALCQRGISTFIGNKELKTGERIEEVLSNIEASKIFVPVLSEGYADSRWCMMEIAKMVECGRPILPIFFHIDPKDVRNQSGPFKHAFQEHESSNKVGKEDLRKWKDALKAVGEMKGHSFQKNTNGTEADLIQEVVKEISSKLNKTAQPIIEHLVGMDSHIDKMYSRLNLTDNEVKMIGIVGMGGVGKTTIASVVYGKLLSDFEDSSFIKDVREGFKKHNGGVALQQKLIKDILKDEHSNIYSVEHGASLIEKGLRSKRVLVILDDADHIEQLEALAGKTDWFGSGSRIIITSRDLRVLLNHGVKEEDIYMPKPLDHDNSLRLFHSHSGFRPTDSEYGVLSVKVVELTGGLPLALKVLGSFLHGRNIIQWKETLEDLKQVPNGEIDRCLRISYDGLEEKVKQIFLDISCFFIGERKEDTTCMWESCGLQSETPISVLQERSLITINEFDEFEMHDLLRDMGRGIVAQEGKPWQRSRLWNLDDLMEIFDCKAVRTMAEGVVITSGDWEGLVNTAHDSKTHLSTEAFFDFSSLRVLHLSRSAFEGQFLRLPRRLKWLRLSDCDFLNGLSGASNLNAISLLEFIRVGDVDRIMMVLSSSSSEAFHALKVLHLVSLGMTRTPDFSKMKCLRKLMLLDCAMLTEVDGSIGSLKSLVHLSVIYCRRLQRLPDSICTLNSLQTLLLMRCRDLSSLPEKLGDMKSLRELRFEYTDIRKIPDSLYDLSNLRTLSLDKASCLIRPPDSMRTLDSLEQLYIDEFEGKNLVDLDSVLWFGYDEYLEWLAVIPNSSCEKVKELTIEDLWTEELPPYLGRLTNLEALSIRCDNLRALPEWLGQLQKLKSLKLKSDTLKALPESLGQLQKLESLTLICCGLEALPESLVQLQKLESLTLICLGLKALPGSLGQLQKLKSLKLTSDSLEALPESLGQLQKLKSFKLKSDSLEALPESLGQLQKLESLKLICWRLEALPESLGQLQKLKSFKLKSNSLAALPEWLGQLQKLESLTLICWRLEALPEWLVQLQKLESLELDCDSLEALLATAGRTFENLKSLWLTCPSLEHVADWMASLGRLEKLSLSSVGSLPPSLSNLAQLQELRLDKCLNESLPPLPSSLRVLHARYCGNLRTISDVSNLKSLIELSLGGCGLLGDFCGLESIAHNLETLELPGPCGGLSMFSRLSPAFMTRLFKEAAFSSLKTFRVFGRKQWGHPDNHEPFWITFPKVGRGGKRPTRVVWTSFFRSRDLEELSLSISIVEEDGHVIYHCTQKYDGLWICHEIGGEAIVGYSREGSYLRMQVSAFASNLKEITQLMDDAVLFVEYT